MPRRADQGAGAASAVSSLGRTRAKRRGAGRRTLQCARLKGIIMHGPRRAAPHERRVWSFLAWVPSWGIANAC